MLSLPAETSHGKTSWCIKTNHVWQISIFRRVDGSRGYIHHRCLCQHVVLHLQKWDSPIYCRIYSFFMRAAVRNPYMHCKAHLAGACAATLAPSYWLSGPDSCLTSSNSWSVSLHLLDTSWCCPSVSVVKVSPLRTKRSTSALLAPFYAFALRFKGGFITQRSLTGKQMNA